MVIPIILEVILLWGGPYSQLLTKSYRFQSALSADHFHCWKCFALFKSWPLNHIGWDLWTWTFLFFCFGYEQMNKRISCHTQCMSCYAEITPNYICLLMHMFVAPILSAKCPAVKSTFRPIPYWVNQHPACILQMNISNLCKSPFIIAVGCLTCNDSLQTWLSFSHVWLLLFGIFFTAIGGDILFVFCFCHAALFWSSYES